MKIAFIDTETGGLDPLTNPILEIGAVFEDSEFEACLNVPHGLLITAEAARVNGWPQSYDGRPSVCERDAITGLLAWFDHHSISHICAHNAPFDYSFLKAAASRSLLDVKRIPRTLCTMSIAHACKAVGRIDPITLSLNSVSASLGLPKRSNVHGALEDAKRCEEIYNLMINPPQQKNTQQPQNTKTRIGFGMGLTSMR
ncbi:MAG: 3'-5' exonuclease [Verrucomicrobiota bacterium]